MPILKSRRAKILLDCRELPAGIPTEHGIVVACPRCGENGIARAAKEKPDAVVRVLHGQALIWNRDSKTGILSRERIWFGCGGLTDARV